MMALRNENLVVGQRITSIEKLTDCIIIEAGKARICIYGFAYDEDENEYDARMEIDIDPNKQYRGVDTFTDWVTIKQT